MLSALLPPNTHTPCTRRCACAHACVGVRGFSLPELLVALAVLGLLSTQALPVWQGWNERLSVEATRDQLILDLQSARVQALQRAQALRLQALSDCTWRSRNSNDWSCGWQLVTGESGEVLLHSPLSQPLSVTYTKTVPLEISARGELGQVGDRWTVQARAAVGGAAQSVCLSGGGRVRWVAAASCS